MSHFPDRYFKLRDDEMVIKLCHSPQLSASPLLSATFRTAAECSQAPKIPWLSDGEFVSADVKPSYPLVN